MAKMNRTFQQGVALPVMLIMLVVMLVSSVYLLKSSNSSTLAASNMAYDAALSKAADLGLHMGYQYIKAQSKIDRTLLTSDHLTDGYYATYDPTASVTSESFWTNYKTVQNTANGTGTPDSIQYVVHRACLKQGAFSDTGNSCLQTSVNPIAGPTAIPPGQSQDVKSEVVYSTPQIHYIITARINGPRGGNVINQMVVLIDG